MDRSRPLIRILIWAALLEGLCILVLVAALLARGGASDEPEGPAQVAAAGLEPARGPPEFRSAVAPESSPAAASDAERDAVAPLEEGNDVSLVHGKVTNEKGDPVSGVYVQFEDDRGDRATAQAQANGWYAIAGLTPGSWTVSITSTGHDPYLEQTEFPAAPEPVRHDIQLQTALMLVVRLVLPDGRSLMELTPEELGFHARGSLGVIATATPIARLPLSNLRSTDRTSLGEFRNQLYSNGKWTEPPKGAIGFLEVHVPPPFHVAALMRQTVLASTVVAEPTGEVTLVVTKEALRGSLARVTLRVVDGESGEPLTDGRIALDDRQSGGWGEEPDEQGIAVLDPVVPGLLVLSPNFKGYERERFYVRVEAGADLDLGTLALHKDVRISGRVELDDGDPTDVQLTRRCLDRMTFPQPLDTGLAESVAADGAFTVVGVGRGRYLLLFRSKAHATTARVVDTSQGNVENLVVRLESGVPVTIIREAQGDAPLLWQVVDEQGLPLLSSLSTWTTPTKIRLLPGSYTLQVFEDLQLLRSRPFRVGSTPLEVGLTP